VLYNAFVDLNTRKSEFMSRRGCMTALGGGGADLNVASLNARRARNSVPNVTHGGGIALSNSTADFIHFEKGSK
jgi:hypothetical protein